MPCGQGLQSAHKPFTLPCRHRFRSPIARGRAPRPTSARARLRLCAREERAVASLDESRGFSARPRKSALSAEKRFTHESVSPHFIWRRRAPPRGRHVRSRTPPRLHPEGAARAAGTAVAKEGAWVTRSRSRGEANRDSQCARGGPLGFRSRGTTRPRLPTRAFPSGRTCAPKPRPCSSCARH